MSTIPSQMAYSTTIKACGILMSLHTLGNHLLYPNISIIHKGLKIGRSCTWVTGVRGSYGSHVEAA